MSHHSVRRATNTQHAEQENQTRKSNNHFTLPFNVPSDNTPQPYKSLAAVLPQRTRCTVKVGKVLASSRDIKNLLWLADSRSNGNNGGREARARRPSEKEQQRRK